MHAAEVFTTGASAASHWRFGNVDRRLFIRLALPGAVGGAVGAYVLTELPIKIVQPMVSGYLALMGTVVLWKALKREQTEAAPPKQASLLGLTGGFLDAIGGGGWGPLVASTLAASGTKMRYVIGSTNAAEFFVAVTISATFVFTIGLELWPIITGRSLGACWQRRSPLTSPAPSQIVR